MRPLSSALAALALAACTVAQPLDLTPAPNAPRKALVENVPLIEQADFHCGPAALAMTLQWAGQDVSQDDIARLAFVPGARGTFQEDMIGAARRRGALALNIKGFDDLMVEVAAGHPVIVFQNLGESFAPIWHYAVVIGYDLERELVTLHSGQLSLTEMSLAKFERTWAGGEGWAFVALAPDGFPATASERDLLDAAAGLERANQPNAASKVYRTGSERWPSNWLWQFGLGNALYALGDPVGARQAWETAVDLEPAAPEPRQNLATLKAELDG